MKSPTLHGELFELVDLLEWHASDFRGMRPVTVTKLLIKIISRHPPPMEPKWWCKCGWVGTDPHHGWEPDHTGMALQPIPGHNLCECGKIR